jgi:hypothetical protein
MSIVRDWDLCPDVDMVLRPLGVDPLGVRCRQSSALGTAEQAVEAGMGLLQPVVLSASLPVREFRHGRVRMEHGHLSEPFLTEHVHAAQSVMVAVSSTGPGVEEAASECLAEDPAIAVALDAFGSAAVELLGQAMCQSVDEEAKAEGLRTTVPLSPGPVGWPVASGQRRIFALVDADSAGVSQSEGCTMVRKKSTSMAIDMGADVEQAGESRDCYGMAATRRYREERISHHG